jgi:hypothetical protein
MLRWAGNVAWMGEDDKCIQNLIGKPERTRPFARPKHKQYILKQILKKLNVKDGVHWINVAQERGQWRVLVNTVMKLWVP